MKSGVFSLLWLTHYGLESHHSPALDKGSLPPTRTVIGEQTPRFWIDKATQESQLSVNPSIIFSCTRYHCVWNCELRHWTGQRALILLPTLSSGHCAFIQLITLRPFYLSFLSLFLYLRSPPSLCVSPILPICNLTTEKNAICSLVGAVAGSDSLGCG